MDLEKDRLAGATSFSSLCPEYPPLPAGLSHSTALRAGKQQSPQWLAHPSIQLGALPRAAVP